MEIELPDSCGLVRYYRVTLFLAHLGNIPIGGLDCIGTFLACVANFIGLLFKHRGLVLHRIGTRIGRVLDTTGQLFGRTLVATSQRQGTCHCCEKYHFLHAQFLSLPARDA
ncbi:MAG: hypothetical protein ABI240_00945 [Sphingomonas sp.]